MSRPRLLLLTAFTLVAFAGNSILCRMALRDTAIDAASFTGLRLLAGAITLALLVQLRGVSTGPRPHWCAALTLFVYAAAFSFAYIRLPAATGALLLFGAVQITMLGWGLLRGDRLGWIGTLGFALAVTGVVVLLLPGLAAPDPLSASLMLTAGAAWGIYSLLGRGALNPLQTTRLNFLRALPLATVLAALCWPQLQWDAAGALYAVLSGALASGVGYALWYQVLPQLRTTQAASLQLSVPVITAIGGVLLLGEPLSLRLAMCSLAILGGIALVIRRP